MMYLVIYMRFILMMILYFTLFSPELLMSYNIETDGSTSKSMPSTPPPPVGLDIHLHNALTSNESERTHELALTENDKTEACGVRGKVADTRITSADENEITGSVEEEKVIDETDYITELLQCILAHDTTLGHLSNNAVTFSTPTWKGYPSMVDDNGNRVLENLPSRTAASAKR